MLEPPIDKMVTKIGCKYALCSLVTKRARFLLEKKPDVLDAAGRRAVTVASQEVFDGIIEVGHED